MRLSNGTQEIEISLDACEVLADIVSEALNDNIEDQTIEDEHVNEIVELLELLQR